MIFAIHIAATFLLGTLFILMFVAVIKMIEGHAKNEKQLDAQVFDMKKYRRLRDE